MKRALRASRLRAGLLSVAVGFAVLNAAAPLPAAAQQLPSKISVVTGTVTTQDGAPVAAATVLLQGPERSATSTDQRGAFQFGAVAPGLYTLTVSKPGFNESRQDGIAVAAGSNLTVNPQLLPASFSSLRQIGRVSSGASGRAPINTSSAAVADVSQQTFLDQGQEQVTKVLNETPGIVASHIALGNGASPASPVIPQIRGALPYETETLVDGHPVSVGANGYFSPLYLNPALLQDVEIGKGPGVLGTDINYAIGGSVNYRTLEPTRTLHVGANLGIDGYGGTSSNVRITGSVPSHVVDYAFAYALDGTPGPLNNYPVSGSQVPLVYGGSGPNADGTGPWFVNGRGYAGIPEGLGPSTTPQYAGLPGQAFFAQPISVCCSTLNTQYLNRAELVKLRFNASQQTALTVSYLGAQSSSDAVGASANAVNPLPPNSNFSSFAPPAGYAGALPAGAGIPFDLVAYNPLYNSVQQSLLQGELRSAIGKTTVLARYYTGTARNYQYNYARPTTESFSGTAYGGAALCPAGVAFNFATTACADGSAPAPVFFNGQPTTFTSGPAQTNSLTDDYLRGYSLELDEPVGANLFTLALDRSHHDSLYYLNDPVQGVVGYQLAPGSGQQFTTILARGQFALTPRVTATLSNYAIDYASHFTGDGGATFHDATRAFDAPRLAVSWRPDVDDAVRFSLGSSIAPPYLSLISAPAQVPQPNSVPASYYTLNTNNGDLKPETSFGYDLGLDKRVGRSISVSTDLYLTNMHDMFLPSTFQSGTYAAAASNGAALPLYITQTQNLAFARYEGFELTLQDAPLQGLGFKLQGALQRGYPYDLPAGFYNTAAGPYTTNLAIIPGANFQTSGLGYNGIGATNAQVGRVPYSTGYVEANLRTLRGVYANLGLTYFGPNNSFNRPAFGVVSAAVRVPVAPGVALQVSGDNLTGAYDKPYFGYLDGVPVPLANGGHGITAGTLGATDGGNYGPTTFRAWLQVKL